MTVPPSTASFKTTLPFAFLLFSKKKKRKTNTHTHNTNIAVQYGQIFENSEGG